MIFQACTSALREGVTIRTVYSRALPDLWTKLVDRGRCIAFKYRKPVHCTHSGTALMIQNARSRYHYLQYNHLRRNLPGRPIKSIIKKKKKEKNVYVIDEILRRPMMNKWSNKIARNMENLWKN